MMRVMLYEAAQSMLRSEKWSWLKACDADRQASRHEEGDCGAGPPVGRILHRIWVDGTEFRWTREAAAA
jgi:hypothetical protein